MIKITVSTSEEAIQIARKMSDTYAVMIVDNTYESDKDFKGVIIYVK